METRRFILALSLSLLVFLVYVRFFTPKPPEHPVQPAAKEVSAEKKARPEPLTAPGPVFTSTVGGREIVIETDLVIAVVNTAGGVITKWELKKFRETVHEETGIKALYKKIIGNGPEKSKKEPGNVQLLPPATGGRDNIVWPLSLIPLEKALSGVAAAEYRANESRITLSKDRDSATLVLTYSGPRGIYIEKSLTFRNNDYKVDVKVETRNIGGYALSLGSDFGIADKLSQDAAGRVGLAVRVDGSTVFDKIAKIKAETRHIGRVAWFGQHDKYFAAALLVDGQGVVSAFKGPGTPETGDILTSSLIVEEGSGARNFGLFAGPKSYNMLQSYGKDLEKLVDYGWFGILAKPMFWLLRQFFIVTHNYGIAIIMLTIVVRLLLFYPSLKSAMAMEEMKALQPELNAIREKYKKDPQRMNQEMMRLYKEKKVNPLGGCLPMILQLPFFVALYNVLNVSIELRQATFISFWIKDLSVHDPYYILPILMGLSMIVTMKMTSTATDPSQQKMFMIMNILFIFLFAWLPAGLLLYITVSNLLSIVQQMIVRKMITAPAA